MNKIIKTSLLAVVVTLISLTGCNKDESVDLAQEQDLIDETTFAETIFEQLAADVDDVTLGDDDASARLAEDETDRKLPCLWRFGFCDCARITKVTDEENYYPVVITIDYGDGCESSVFDIVKSGVIKITITGKMSEEGSQRIVTFEDYFVNGNQILGTFTLTNLGNASWKRTLVGGMIITEEGDTITRESERIRKRKSGDDPEDRRDDYFKITGWASGNTAEGNSYDSEITTALIRPVDCFWITSGIITKTINDEDVIVIDFGDGTCDNVATKTINDGEPEEFLMNCKMKRWKWLWRWRNHYKKGS
jgi:hypothetical protein